MRKWTRRNLLKTGLAASAGAIAGANASAQPDSAPDTEQHSLAGQGGKAFSGNTTLRQRLSLDFGWRFQLGHASDPDKDFGFGKLSREATYAKSGATGQVTGDTMDDSKWEEVNLPHDWAVALPFVLEPTLAEHGGKPLGREFPATSIGWYRRAIDIPASDQGRRIRIEFDGVYRDAIVFMNGHYLGQNFSGYAPFSFDVTDFLDYGKKNILTLRVDASLNEGWFYEGAGIYRHVWLTKTPPLHLRQDGTVIHTEIKAFTAALAIASEVDNESGHAVTCRLHAAVMDEKNRPVATSISLPATIPAGASATFNLRTNLDNPSLWTLEHPYLYRLVTVLESEGTAVDQDTTTFGVRSIRFDADKGFLLNGKPVKIKGTCNHHDHAGVGTAMPDGLHSYRLNLLQQMGSNACRTSHNPPAPEFLDACDRMGFLVMEETRNFSSSPEGLGELERMIRRDRNHPCVVIWSLANEEPQQGTPRGARMLATMKKLVRKLDPTRPVTAAMNGEWGKGFSDVVDVQGYNYGNYDIDAFRKAHPHMPLIGTETASTLSTRGIYRNDEARGYVSAYDTNIPSWGSTAEGWWKFYDSREWLSGGFLWTGFDYRGEPTPYHLPCISSHFGIIDTCGFPKDAYYYYKAWWSPEPSLHLFPHWTWPGKEGQEIEVWCYSNQDSVELFLNGTSLGKQVMEKNGHLVWKVPYAPGRLEAKAMKDGVITLTALQKTAGPAAKILLRANQPEMKADGRDIVVLQVALLDRNGIPVPTAGNTVAFKVSGPATLIGVGNGDPSCHEADRAMQRSAFNGLCMAVLQSQRQAGAVEVIATSSGLEAGKISVICQPADDPAGKMHRSEQEKGLLV